MNEVREAVRTAHEYVSELGIDPLIRCVSANMTGQGCDVFTEFKNVVIGFGVHNGWISGHSGSRPVASEGVFESVAWRMLFWLSYAFATLTRSDALKGIMDSVSTPSAALEIQKQETSRWEVILSVFPSYERWRDEVGNSPRFQEMLSSLCNDKLVKYESQENKLNDAMRACWDTNKLQIKSQKSSWTRMKFIPEAMVACFAFSLLFREGSIANHCSIQSLGEQYQCTNGAFRNSICVMVCENDYDEFGVLVNYRAADPSSSRMMVCSSLGEWNGGPNQCNSFPANVMSTEAPHLTGTPAVR